MSHSPTVTVLIPTYNREKYVGKTIQSILNQTIPVDQIIVIDDGSTDNTKEAVSRFGSKIHYLKKENGGKSTALNMAIPYVTSEYTWIMDDDDIALPNAVASHMRVLGKSPEIDFTYSSFYRGHENCDNPDILCVYMTESPLDIDEKDLFVYLLESCFIDHPSIFVKTKCYRELGGFRDEFYRCQDYEMLVRLAYHFQGRRVNESTFVSRTHNNERGPKNLRFNHKTQFNIISNKFNGIFISEYYRKLDIIEYQTTDMEKLSEEKLRVALLLRRASIMAIHGLWDLFFNDIRQLKELSSDNWHLKNSETQLLKKKIGYVPWHTYKMIKSVGKNKLTNTHIPNDINKIFLGMAVRQVIYNYKHIKWHDMKWFAPLNFLFLKKILCH